MEFEWDLAKAKTNLDKHGVDFREAATVFMDPHGKDIPDQRHSTVREARVIRIGMSLVARVLMVVYTERGRKNEKEKIRIISCRRANAEERALYLGEA